MRITTLIRCQGIIQISPCGPSAKEKRNDDGEYGGQHFHAESIIELGVDGESSTRKESQMISGSLLASAGAPNR